MESSESFGIINIDIQVLCGDYLGHIQSLVLYLLRAVMMEQSKCFQYQKINHTVLFILIQVIKQVVRSVELSSLIVNSVSWAPYEYGLCLMAASADGSISCHFKTSMIIGFV